MSKCKHKKLMLLSANDVEFIPDEEPYEAGVIEPAGIDNIFVDLNMHYCPKCNVVIDVTIEPKI
jgi:hypothetical protein